MRAYLKALSTPMPVYITRKSASGETGTLTLSIWMALLVLILAWANVALWGAYGVAQALGHLV